MKTYSYHTLTETDLERLLKRPKMDFKAVFDQVRPILKEVQTEGNTAVKACTVKFDNVELDEITVSPSEIDVKLPADVQHAIDQAFDNLYRFHKAQQIEDLEIETMEGVVCRRVARPIQRVGIYIPGGTAPLPSTAMMLGVPAMIAGCETIVLATPPDKNGQIPDSILYIAKKTGVKTILKAGGAQAIAAMAYGTESVPKVDKIFGPGNQYVTAAKMLLRNSEAMISIDMPAGPSEVLVIADESADPEFIAADLLSQAEHGADSQVVLVAAGSVNLSEIEKEIEKQTARLPRKKIAQDALKNSFVLIADTTEEAMQFSNLYAPEHLILNTADADTLSESVTNAGSVFIGPNTPESMGDYASGTNHTLPTYGYAKMYSGVSLQSFQKYITLQKISEKGLKNLGPTVETLAELEGLAAHKNAVSVRLRKLK